MDLHLPLDRGAGRFAAQLADGLRAAVRDGRLAPGARLPSTRGLAADLGVSRGVVVTAYEQLVAEGFVVSRQGAGTRVAPAPSVRGPAPPSSEAYRRALSYAAETDAGPADPPGIRYDLRPGKPDLASFPRERWAATLRDVLRSLPHAALWTIGLVNAQVRELRETQHQFRGPFVLDSSAAQETFGLTPPPLQDSVAFDLRSSAPAPAHTA